YWARELTKLGHEVRLMPAKDVKAYLKRNKNDAADAEAICEAVRRPTMRFVSIKSPEQQSQQPVDGAPCARSADPPAHPGDQCLAGAFGRARHRGGARARRAQEAAGDHCGCNG